MINFFNILIDFIFPPRAEELELRSISPEEFYETRLKSAGLELSFIKSIFSYKDPIVRELVWQIKYKKNKHSIRCAGFALYCELKNKLVKPGEQALLIPIPISDRRRKERGYNQCELIINEIIRLDDRNNQLKTNFGLIKRVKHVEKQTFMKRNERLKNIKNIFDVINNNIDKSTKIIIIDDVVTTGSTLNEARGVFLSAGFTEVYCQVIAH